MSERHTDSSTPPAAKERPKVAVVVRRRWWVAAGLAAVLACAPEGAVRPDVVGMRDDSVTTQSATTPAQVVEESSQSVVRTTAEAATPPASGTVSDLVQGIRTLRQLPADSITKWRNGLDRIAKMSRRGDASVSMRRMILDAIAAPSDAEFHERLAQLPVTITSAAGYNNGVSGQYRSYAVRGAAPIRLFFPSRSVGRQPPDDDASSWIEGDGDGERIIVNAAFVIGAEGAPETPALDVCSTTWEGIPYQGDCATQQEIDEGLAAIAAMDVELADDSAEAEQLCLEKFQEACDVPYEEDVEVAVKESTPVAALLYELEDGSEEYFVLPAVEAMPTRGSCGAAGKVRAAVDVRILGSASTQGCAVEAASFAVGVLSWIVAKATVYDVVTAGASSLGVTVAVTGTILAGLGAGLAIGSYISCLQEKT